MTSRKIWLRGTSNLSIYLSIYIYIYIYMCVCVCVCAYIYIYIYIYKHTHTSRKEYIYSHRVACFAYFHNGTCLNKISHLSYVILYQQMSLKKSSPENDRGKSLPKTFLMVNMIHCIQLMSCIGTYFTFFMKRRRASIIITILINIIIKLLLLLLFTH